MTPVPPLAKPNVPAKVMAPVVAAAGVSPVVPALNVETPYVATRFPIVTCFVALLSAESLIKTLSALTGVDLVGYEYITAI